SPYTDVSRRGRRILRRLCDGLGRPAVLRVDCAGAVQLLVGAVCVLLLAVQRGRADRAAATAGHALAATSVERCARVGAPRRADVLEGDERAALSTDRRVASVAA